MYLCSTCCGAAAGLGLLSFSRSRQASSSISGVLGVQSSHWVSVLEKSVVMLSDARRAPPVCREGLCHGRERSGAGTLCAGSSCMATMASGQTDRYGESLLPSSSTWRFCCSSAASFVSDNHSQVSRASLRIRILDVNDNPPELATPYEAAVCEDAKPGQVPGVPRVVLRQCQAAHPSPSA